MALRLFSKSETGMPVLLAELCAKHSRECCVPSLHGLEREGAERLVGPVRRPGSRSSAKPAGRASASGQRGSALGVQALGSHAVAGELFVDVLPAGIGTSRAFAGILRKQAVIDLLSGERFGIFPLREYRHKTWSQSERQRICTAATKDEGLLQYLAVPPRHLLSFSKAFPITCRCLCMRRPIPLFSLRLDSEGTATSAPACRPRRPLPTGSSGREAGVL